MSRLEKICYEGDPAVYGPHTRACARRHIRPGTYIEFRQGNAYVLAKFSTEIDHTYDRWFSGPYYAVEIMRGNGTIVTTAWRDDYDGWWWRSWALRTEADWIMAVINGGYKRSLRVSGVARPRSPYRPRQAGAGA
jgi:hypothetical protein